MSFLSPVEEQFKHKAIRRGNILLFTKPDSLLFVKECKKQGVKILGIDGFFITEDTT